MLTETYTQPDRRLKGNVLIVDDNDINRFLVKKVLTGWGITTDTAENGLAAIEKVKASEYDAVLMDIYMPVMNGLEATSLIRHVHNEKFKDLPVIALTAALLENDLEEIKEAGMNDYVIKPFVADDLYNKLKNLLEKQS